MALTSTQIAADAAAIAGVDTAFNVSVVYRGQTATGRRGTIAIEDNPAMAGVLRDYRLSVWVEAALLPTTDPAPRTICRVDGTDYQVLNVKLSPSGATWRMDCGDTNAG